MIRGSSIAELDLSGYLVENVLGANDGSPAPKGLVIDNLVVGAAGMSEAEAAASLYEEPDPELPDPPHAVRPRPAATMPARPIKPLREMPLSNMLLLPSCGSASCQ